MKIIKYLHSCLLVEEQGISVLIDPGNYTVNDHGLDINTLTKLDYLLYTHEHPDHLDIPFAKQLVDRFPHVTIITNPSIVSILQKEGISAISEGNEVIKLEVVTHEKLWDKEPPQNAIFTVFDKLTHPGDAMSFTKTAEILALPLQAPWGSTNRSVMKALEVMPKFIIPIHDWHWKDEIRIPMYTRLAGFFKEKGIEFKGVETGEAIEI